MRLQIPGRALPRLALVLALCRGAGAAAQSLPIPPEAAEAPTRDDVVRGLFRQVLEREPSAAEVPGWRAQLDAGTTVRQLVVTFASTTEYRDRFITPYDSRTAVAFLYRHLLAREADPGGVDFWASYAAANGWPAAVSSMTASQEYLDHFGELAVPGHPVTAWDPRAEVMVEPRAGAATTERNLCLTVAAGGGAAYECGDLRLAHPLPSVRALNRVRAPTLIYNSQHQAAPFPLVAARVKPPVDMGTLDRIDAVLYVTPPGGAAVERARRSWQGAELAAWTPGQVRRIALRASDANGDATGSYFYRVVVTFTSGGTTRTAQLVGEAGVVNRRSSAFGAGWWLAGLERVVVVTDVKLFWVGGDGSARVYRRVGGTAAAFVAPVVDRPDTIRAVTDADYPGARYERRLSGGARVYFDAFGRHIATVNRLDQHTLFTYDAQGRLDAVWVPVGPGYYAGKVRYRFAYNAAGRLASVIAPDLNDQPARTVTVLDAPGDAMRVGGFRDPDQATVSFDYDAAGRIAGRTNQRGTRVEFGWDAGGKLASARVAMGGTVADIVTSFTAQESRGFAGSEGVGSPVAVEQAYTLMDGPRTDSLDQTRLWVDRWGGPWLVQDALGNVSRLRRDNWRLPALVTETRAPNGLVSRGWYNARGNPDSTTMVNPLGDGRNATTRYAYGNAYWPDFATQVTAPEGEVTLMDYDNAAGNRIWQQPGTDPARRVYFGYRPADGSAAAGLPISVTYPQAAGQAAPGVERYDYDARGNLAGVTSPLGFRTINTADLLGRVTSVRTPVNQAQTLFQVDSSVYDVMDRVAHTEGVGPALNGTPEQRVITDTEYLGGLPLSITRTAGTTESITTRYRYDRAGRKVAEVAPDATPSVLTDNPVDSTVYDPAGNVREVHTRRSDPVSGQRLVILMEYDRLNRMVKRVTPAVHYDSTLTGIPTRLEGAPAYNACTVVWGQNRRAELLHSYPRYSNDGACGFLVPADTAVFTFDPVAGTLLAAQNRTARIRRSYFPSGLVQSDSTYLRTLAGGGGAPDLANTPHRYGLAFTYDLDGRRTTLRHPLQLATDRGVARDLVSYAYDPATGAPSRVTDPLGNVFTWAHNAGGGVDSLMQAPSAGAPSASVLRYTYDIDGRLLQQSGWGAATGSLLQQQLAYDPRGRILLALNTVGTRDSLTATYSGLGHLLTSNQVAYASTLNGQTSISRTAESFTYTGLGNRVTSSTTLTRTVSDGLEYTYRPGFSGETYEASTGRLLTHYNNGGRYDVYSYDGAGNTAFQDQTANSSMSQGLENRISYYGADGKLAGADWRTVPNASNEQNITYRVAFDEYWYDALGRRVLVRARRYGEGGFVADEAKLSFARRTVWDGGAELWEIQMPTNYATVSQYTENDTDTIPNINWSFDGNAYVDPNPFWGRVAYTHGTGIDQPLSITRFGYGDEVHGFSQNYAFRNLPAFTIIPVWDSRGDPRLGTYGHGEMRVCDPGTDRCIYATWPLLWFAWQRDQVKRSSWHGTLLEDKRDHTGTMYRRNRVYDPATGRFTQEDPIGLAGGVNVYGFANGDPVSYGDPFGLCPRWMRAIPAMCDSFDDRRPAEQMWILAHKRQAYRAYQIEQQVYADLEKVATIFSRYDLRHRHNTPVDAVRHFTLSCRLTLAFGAGTAKEITDAHEGANQDGSRDPANETAMDQHNNQQGRQAAQSGQQMRPDDCVWAAVNADSMHDLDIINDNGRGFGDAP